jgi:hypothetical protein
MSIEALISSQNSDGGWPYRHGSSWTEPTVYAVLSLADAGKTAPAQRGIAWLIANQRPDGGWPPSAGIDESCWATALVALIPGERLGTLAHRQAIRWLLGTTGEETTSLYRLREWLLGNSAGPETRMPGWPWVPGSAAWVGPTALAMLALAKENRQRPSAAAEARIVQGRRFLIDRMCQGGGWNHGSVRALGYEAPPYPETTGMALAALRGCENAGIEPSVSLARRFLGECRSADALNWLRLGLRAQERLPEGYDPPAAIAYRTVPEMSLDLLVKAAEQGRNVFWM